MKSFVGKVVQDILCFFGVHVEGETTTEFRGWAYVGIVKCANCGVEAKMILDIESSPPNPNSVIEVGDSLNVFLKENLRAE